MVRINDEPGQQKHLRFKCTEKAELAGILEGFPGVKAIVLHKMGKSGEHPHLHVWYEAEKPITNETVRNRLRKYNDFFKGLSGQNDWSSRNHDNFTAWADYVTRNLSHTVLLTYQDLSLRSSNALILPIDIGSPTRTVISTPGPRAPAPRVVKSRLTQSEKMILYATNELHWVKPRFTLSHYEDPHLRKQMFKELNQTVVRCTRGRFNDPQAISLLRNLLYEFADDDLQESLEQIFCKTANNFLV